VSADLYDICLKILKDIGEEGNFILVSLIDGDGITICNWGDESHLDLLYHISVQLERPIRALREAADGTALDELICSDVTKMSYIFRFFIVKNEQYVLATVLHRNQPYRRATSRAIKKLTSFLSFNF